MIGILMGVLVLALVVGAIVLRQRSGQETIGANRYKAEPAPRVRRHKVAIKMRSDELPVVHDEPVNDDEIDPLGLAPCERGGKQPIPNDAQISLQPPPPPSPLIVVFLMADPGKPYQGYELLQALLSVGLRYGRRQIFHLHCVQSEKCQFSVASAQQPGTFDLSNMGATSTCGLTLFFDAETVPDPEQSYTLMCDTVGELLESLGGQVLDDQRQPLTPETVIAHRQQIKAYLEAAQPNEVFVE